MGGARARAVRRGDRLHVVALLGMCLIGACSPPREPADLKELLLVGYDLSIADEQEGKPVQRAEKSWTEHWLGVISALQSADAEGKPAPENYNEYIRYIIACRRAAGLPDLPGHSSANVASPFGGCDVSGAGRFAGDEVKWASREQVVEAAARCGVRDFQPTKAGAAWAAYVPGEDPDHGPQGDCIYADLKRRGLLATR